MSVHAQVEKLANGPLGPRSGRRWPRLAIVVAATFGLCATLGLYGSAGAASSVQAGDVPVLQLSEAQRQALQAEVTKHLNDYGEGMQIGINQISYDNGRTILTLPLPGETKARAVHEPVAQLGAATDCHNNDRGWACLWSDTNFNGARLEGFDCETRTLRPPFNTSTASIYNSPKPQPGALLGGLPLMQGICF